MFLCFACCVSGQASHLSGRYTWPNGSYFEGDFVDNDIHGYGTYVWTDGCVYRGQWAKQQMNGEGVFEYPDGRKYEGLLRSFGWELLENMLRCLADHSG